MLVIVLRGGVATRVAAAEFALDNWVAMQAQIASNPSVLPLHELLAATEVMAVVRGARA